MSMKITRAAYKQLIAEDLAWLDTLPRTLERDHVRLIVEHSEKNEYGPEIHPSWEAASVKDLLEAIRHQWKPLENNETLRAYGGAKLDDRHRKCAYCGKICGEVARDEECSVRMRQMLDGLLGPSVLDPTFQHAVARAEKAENEVRELSATLEMMRELARAVLREAPPVSLKDPP